VSAIDGTYERLADALEAYEMALEDEGFPCGAEAVHWFSMGLPVPEQLRAVGSRDMQARSVG
jgi:hypothetical protein